MGRAEMVGQTFVELADTLVEDYEVIEFLNLLAERCVQLLGVADAGIVLIDGDDLRLVASSSERMRLVELIELQRDDGPCLDCCRDGGRVREDDLEGAVDRWPKFAPAALAAGFRSAYAVPLRLRQERIGALNLFADGVGGLGEDDQALGQAMADVATIGILHQRLLEERTTLTGQLQTALNSRVAIEQAKGRVAEQAGVDLDEAFRLIRGYARHHNRRLSEVVAAIIDRDLTAVEMQSTSSTAPATLTSHQKARPGRRG